jgi:lipoprotein-anchoring transpeptidase ErfK/SrfK
MFNSRFLTPARSAVALALLLALASGLGSTAAYAADTTPTVPVVRPPVTSGATFNGSALAGMSEADARAFIAAGSTLPSLTPVITKGDGRTFSFPATAAVSVNVTKMLAQAYATSDTAPFEIAPVYSVSSSVVNRWVRAMAGKIDRKAVNAKRSVKGHKLRVSAEKSGRKVDRKATASRITARLRSELASPGVVPAPVAIAYKVLKPSVTRKNMGKTIIVSLSKRRIYLYKTTKVEKSYPCAIGTSSYPTPKGTWRIVRKTKNPTWYNPYSDWSRNMPASISGARSPLGTRALYLNASGIRIHGTTKDYSIGTAASHGCMRMHRWHIEDLYPRVPVGTTVYIVR